MKKRTSISDIARQADVSISTVSRAFKNNSNINSDTRRRILEIANSQDYHPLKYTPHSKSTINSVVGIVVADLRNSFFLDVIHSLTDILNANGIRSFICDSHESANHEMLNLSTLKEHVDGLIISLVNSAVDYNAEFLINLDHSGIPVILIDRDISQLSLDGVFQNSYNGAFLAVDTLVQNGHRNIAIISGPITTKPGLDCLTGYMDSLKHHNITINPNYILYGDFLCESGRILTSRLLHDAPEVTAIFCANNMMAQGALQAISEAHLRIPNDISLFSYGLIDMLTTEGFGISGMELPSTLMGEECGRMMVERLQNQKNKKYHIPRRITFDAQLVLKGSEIYPDK